MSKDEKLIQPDVLPDEKAGKKVAYHKSLTETPPFMEGVEKDDYLDKPPPKKIPGMISPAYKDVGKDEISTVELSFNGGTFGEGPRRQITPPIRSDAKKQADDMAELTKITSNPHSPRKKKHTYKKGILNSNEKSFILANLHRLNDEEIGEAINRRPGLIAKVRKKYQIAQDVVVDPSSLTKSATTLEKFTDLIFQLRTRHYWPKIQAKLLPGEEKQFENEWAALMDQFAETDIKYTDELMVNDLIMAGIRLDRNITRQRKILIEVKRLEKFLELEYRKESEFQNSVDIAQWKTQLTALYVALESLEKSHSELQKRRDVLFRGLKTTRDQRFKSLQEESKKDFFAFFEQFNVKEVREREGRLLELNRLAAQKVKQQYSEPIQYADGTVDLPLLTSENCKNLTEFRD